MKENLLLLYLTNIALSARLLVLIMNICTLRGCHAFFYLFRVALIISIPFYVIFNG